MRPRALFGQNKAADRFNSNIRGTEHDGRKPGGSKIGQISEKEK